MSDRRFYVAPDDLPPAGTGATAVIRGEEHHHLSRVLRLGKGDEVSLFDGRGRGFRGLLESIAPLESRVRLVASDDRAVEPSFRLTLAQGIPRHDRMELVVQKSTELGVASIVPIIGERTVLQPPRGERRWSRLERWRRVAREAARQSGRLRVPEVEEPVPWERFVERPQDDAAHRRFILTAAEAQGGAPPGIELGAAARSATLAVGPEGGWSGDELASGIRLGFAPIGLGPRVLRTETAGIVAVALILFLAGEMGTAGRARPLP